MKKTFTLILLASFFLPGISQNYPFICYDANVIHYDSTAPAMQHFFNKWYKVHTTGQGTVSIVHMGGSHVQAGTFPHRVRTRLLSDNPTLVGSRGLLFPYSAAAKCNNPADYRVHCLEKVRLTRNVYKNLEIPLGLCGIAVTASDTLTRIQIIDNEPLFNYASSHIVVLGYSPEGVVPRLSYEGREVHPSYVDSTTHRYIFNLRNEVDSFDIVLPCGQGQTFTLTGVSLGNRRPGITYHSIGVNGASVPDYLKCDYLTDDLRLLHPDMVLFGIGINDAAGKDFDTVLFRNNYLRLCDSIRSVNPNCAFVFITNNDSYRRTGRRKYAVNRNGLLARDVCYRLAAETGGAVWDQFEIMGGLKSMEKWQKAGLAQRDKVHFTRAGYLLLGDLFYDAFICMVNQNATRPKALPVSTTPPPRAKTTQDNAPVKTQRTDSTKAQPQTPTPAKKTPKHATIQPPANNDNKPIDNWDDDRFPYISQ